MEYWESDNPAQLQRSNTPGLQHTITRQASKSTRTGGALHVAGSRPLVLLYAPADFCYAAAVPKPDHIELPTGERIPILYEDRSVLAVDKPRGWMLVPVSWQKTGRNLQAALNSSIAAGDFWARSRNLKFLRFIHRLDAETTGILLLGRSPGAVETYSELFRSRKVEKVYLAVVHGALGPEQWVCRVKLAPDPHAHGKMKPDPGGKEAETRFRVLLTEAETSLVQAQPLTGRTHQIRVHLARSGHPVLGDELYGPFSAARPGPNLALRAVGLAFTDPFTKRPVHIRAAADEFCREYGFDAPE
jgi:RluA family pseudouridine synthase